MKAADFLRLAMTPPFGCPDVTAHAVGVIQRAMDGEMTETIAREVLEDDIQPDGTIYCLHQFMHGPFIQDGHVTITLDADFTLEQLEAIVFWIKSHPPKTL